MKLWILALAIMMTVGLTAISDACHKGKGNVKGKVTSISNKAFTMTAHGKHVGQQVTVHVGSGTTITGGSLDSSLVGKEVSVEGSGVGNAIRASSVTIAGVHHKRAA